MAAVVTVLGQKTACTKLNPGQLDRVGFEQSALVVAACFVSAEDSVSAGVPAKTADWALGVNLAYHFHLYKM